jgi:hypothetical protein
MKMNAELSLRAISTADYGGISLRYCKCDQFCPVSSNPLLSSNQMIFAVGKMFTVNAPEP